jgi:hypothetical protein
LVNGKTAARSSVPTITWYYPRLRQPLASSALSEPLAGKPNSLDQPVLVRGSAAFRAAEKFWLMNCLSLSSYLYTLKSLPIIRGEAEASVAIDIAKPGCLNQDTTQRMQFAIRGRSAPQAIGTHFEHVFA